MNMIKNQTPENNAIVYETLNSLIDKSNQGYIILNNEYKVLYMTRSSLYNMGLRPVEDYKGKDINNVFEYICSPKELFKLENVLKTGFPYSEDNIIVRSEFINVYLSIKVEKIRKFIGITLYNFIDMKSREYEIERREYQLKEMISCLSSIREEERQIIARKLHDDMGQDLTGVKFVAYNLCQKLRNEKNSYSNLADELYSLIDNSITDLKSITSKMMSPVYKTETLAKRVIYKVNEFRKIYNIEFSVLTEPKDLDMRSDDAEDIVKILQEALTNIVRHSEATKVKVELIKLTNRIVLSVKDNGIGIREDEINSSDSFGLKGMFMRCGNKGRKLFIKGKPGKGTSIRAVFGFDNNDNN